MHVKLRELTSDDLFGLIVDPVTTRVKISLVTSGVLPPDSSTNPACHEPIFRQASSVIAKNLARIPEKRLRLRMLVFSEDEDAGPDLCRKLAKHQGLGKHCTLKRHYFQV